MAYISAIIIEITKIKARLGLIAISLSRLVLLLLKKILFLALNRIPNPSVYITAGTF